MLKGSRGGERAQRRTWTPGVERVAMLAGLSHAFTRPGATCKTAVMASVVGLAEGLGDAVVVYEVSPNHHWMRALATHHLEPRARDAMAPLDTARLRADAGFTAAALDTGETQVVPRVAPDEVNALQPELAPIWKDLGAVGFVLCPIALRGFSLGLVVQCRLREAPPLDDDDRRFLEEIAARLAMGIASWPPTLAVWD